MSEPPNTEARLATLRYYLNIVAEEDAHAEAIAALDAIASELERVRAERDAIGAALGEPCAECGHIDWRTDGYADRFLGLQARLDRAEEALRGVMASGVIAGAWQVARAYFDAKSEDMIVDVDASGPQVPAVSGQYDAHEFELVCQCGRSYLIPSAYGWPDGDEVGQETC